MEMASVTFKRPGIAVEDFSVPQYFIQEVGAWQVLAGGNARFVYYVQRGDIWTPVVELIRPIALLEQSHRMLYPEAFDGTLPIATH